MKAGGRNKRNRLVSLVHIARAKARVCIKCGMLHFGKSECCQCGRTLSHMPDFWYRSILEAAGGADSCALMDEQGLQKVMDVFNQAGFREACPYVSPKAEQTRQNSAVRRNICIRAEEVLGSNWQARLLGFIKANFEKDSLDFCDAQELRKVIGWINRTDKRQKGEEI